LYHPLVVIVNRQQPVRPRQPLWSLLAQPWLAVSWGRL
jgi:hypothetical protein